MEDLVAMNDFASNDAALQRLLVESVVSRAQNITKDDNKDTEKVEATKEANQHYRDFANGEECHKLPLMVEDIRLQKLPTKLNAMLSDPEINHIISWMPHGRAWKIWKKKEFIKDVLPRYFEYCNYNSFVRLVNAWGFRRITFGLDANSYYHELFLRGMPCLHNKMHRLKKNQKKAPATLQAEPDFYAMDRVSPLPSADHSEGDKHLAPRRPLEVSQKNKLMILPKQVPQLSPVVAAGAPSQPGNAQMTNYLVGQQQHQEQLAASPLYQGLNQNALIANQLFAQQQRQISLSLPTNILGSILTKDNTASASAITAQSTAVLPISNDIGETTLLNAVAGYGNNNAAAINILKLSIQQQQQQQQQRLLGVTMPATNAASLLNGFHCRVK